MPVPTDKQIQQWQDRWTQPHTEHLPDQIARILKGNEPAKTDEEAAKRMWKVNCLLNGKKWRDEFDVDHSKGTNQYPWNRNSFLVPVLDLKGIDWTKRKLDKIAIPFAHLEGAYMREAHLEGASMSGAHLEGAYMSGAHLEGAYMGEAHLEGADMRWAHLEGAYMREAHLEGAKMFRAHLEGAKMFRAHLDGAKMSWTNLEGAKMREAHLEGADMREAHLEGAKMWEAILFRTNCSFTTIGEIRKNENEEISSKQENTLFAKNWFVPRWGDWWYSLLKKIDWLQTFVHRCDMIAQELYTDQATYFFPIYFSGKLWLKARKQRFHVIPIEWWKPLLQERWFFTNFTGVDIDKCDTTEAGDLVRYIKDQQFLRAFKQKQPLFYWFWNLTTNCGYSATRVAFWGLGIILLFAWIFMNAPFTFMPDWYVDCLSHIPILSQLVMEPGQTLVDPNLAGQRLPDTLLGFWKYFFISFDIFTNLGVRSTHPACNAGVIAVFCETVAGFMSLGLMIAVLTNKYARRS